jgi:hypothetical protein
VWLEKLAEVDAERRRYLKLAARGSMTEAELDAALAELEETRTTAEWELAALHNRQEAIAKLEREKEALLEYYAAIAPEALDSLAPEERHQLYKMLRLEVVVRPDANLEVRGAFGEGLLVSNLELVPGLQEDLACHRVRAQLAGALLGEASCPSPEKRRYLRELIERLVGPRHTRGLHDLRFLLPSTKSAVERVGQDARSRVAHERPPHEGTVGDGGTEREERDVERLGNPFFQVRPDDEVWLCSLDAGADFLRVVLDECLVGEGMGVEEKVAFEVLQVGAAGGDLEPDLPGEDVAESQRIGKVPEDDDPPLPERLRPVETGVPR